MTLRANGGTGASSDFYSNTNGNLTTGFGGTGTTLSSWLTTQGGQTTYAFVSKWYDQSVTHTNHGTQTTTSSQPIYDVANKLINFGYTGSPNTNCSFILPDGTIPYGNSSYTVTIKHKNISVGGWIGSGTNTASSLGNNFRINGSQYLNYWTGNDFGAGTYAVGNVVTFKYDNVSTSTILYLNSTSVGSMNRTARASTTANNTIGTTVYNEYLNGLLYYVYSFNSALSDADRIIIEATTYT